MKFSVVLALAVTVCVPAAARAQAPDAKAPAATTTGAVEGITPPADYVIGPEDVLSVFVWREKDLTADVMVRPDGRVSLPLLNDIQAAGLTPEQFRETVTKAAARYVEEPNVTIVVKEINSRKVFVTGEVEKPGTYPLLGPLNVLQLITLAGGLREYADAKNITIQRNVGGSIQTLKFNYKDVIKGKRLEQNILLKPGDTVIVP